VFGVLKVFTDPGFPSQSAIPFLCSACVPRRESNDRSAAPANLSGIVRRCHKRAMAKHCRDCPDIASRGRRGTRSSRFLRSQRRLGVAPAGSARHGITRVYRAEVEWTCGSTAHTSEPPWDSMAVNPADEDLPARRRDRAVWRGARRLVSRADRRNWASRHRRLCPARSRGGRARPRRSPRRTRGRGMPGG
jgi:hypothetical protein